MKNYLRCEGASIWPSTEFYVLQWSDRFFLLSRWLHLIWECSQGLEHEAPFIQSSSGKIDSAATKARFASLHGLAVAPSPSRRRAFHFANRTLVTSLHC